MNKKLVIVGAGEFAEIAYEYFTYDSDYEIVGFVVEKDYIKEKELFGKPITPLEDILTDYLTDNIFYTQLLHILSSTESERDYTSIVKS